MEIRFIKKDFDTSVSRKNVEVIKVNGKYYIMLDEYGMSDSLETLAMSLSSEITVLKDRIIVLEERLRLYERGDSAGC